MPVPRPLSSATVTPPTHGQAPASADISRAAAAITIAPVWQEWLCDGLTPLGLYAALRERGTASFLLESVVGGERWARYSFLGVGYRSRITGSLRGGESRVHWKAEPGPGMAAPPQAHGEGGVDGVRALLSHYRAAREPTLPRFWGGLVGVFGHDIIREIMGVPLPQAFADQLDGPTALPTFELLASDRVVIFDMLSQQVFLVATECAHDEGGLAASRQRAHARIEELAGWVREARPRPAVSLASSVGQGAHDAREATRVRLAANQVAPSYPERVRAAKEQILAGEVFQLVLSQRFVQDNAGPRVTPLDVYRQLRRTDPSPYMMLLELGSGALAGASPELLVRVDAPDVDARVTVRPIAGTRPRGATPEEDLELEAELRADPKERAEHLMLIDLGRNDVGRVAAPGSVAVRESFVVERYSRVMHLVSEVQGRLRPELDAVAAFAATFPAGTLSGAPKRRAIELIDELESIPRDWYGGAVGYFGYDGAADFAICIRTAVFAGDELRIQAGAGIVYDSVPELEDQECRNKALAVATAVELAARTNAR